jgi:hypothetical protein
MRLTLRGLPAGLLWLAWLMLLGLAGCSSSPFAMAPGQVPDSQLSFDRTFDMAVAAMADQRITFSEQDRRQGRIVGSVDGSTLVTTVRPMRDGTTRVSFEPQGHTPADEALLLRVSNAYNERMSKLGLLGGFDRSGVRTDRGPVPCPSGPAFCP